MTKEEYAVAYMDGANDAWELARKDPEYLKKDFLTIMGARLLADDISKMFEEGEG